MSGWHPQYLYSTGRLTQGLPSSPGHWLPGFQARACETWEAATSQSMEERQFFNSVCKARGSGQMLQIYQWLREPSLAELLLLNWPDVHLSSSLALVLRGKAFSQTSSLAFDRFSVSPGPARWVKSLTAPVLRSKFYDLTCNPRWKERPYAWKFFNDLRQWQVFF